MTESLITDSVKFYVESSRYPWIEIDQTGSEKILAHLNHLIEPLPFNAKSTTARYKELPFYPKAKLVCLTETATIPPVTKYAIYNESEEGSFIINWTNKPIYSANKTQPISITGDNVKDYIRFFYTFIAGRHGHFYMIESEFDCNLVVMDSSLSKLALQTLAIQKPLKYEEDKMVVNSLLYFMGTLTSVDVSVDRQGIILMGNEKIIINPPKSLRDAWNEKTK